MKTYFDIEGDGGSDIIGQVVGQKNQINANLSHVKHVVAIASGKGGVGKSTLTMQLAAALKAQGSSVSLLDADLNGPSLARLAGLQHTVLVPGSNGLAVPKTKAGIGVVSIGSMVPEGTSVDFANVAPADSHVWRATKEFATLAQFLGCTDWGTLDYLIIDLPPGAERCFQYAEFLGSDTKFVLVTIPSELSRGVVSRSIAALRKTTAPIVGVIENMSGYFCADCDEVKPLFPIESQLDFDIPILGKIPFDPELAALCDKGLTIAEHPDSLVSQAVHSTVRKIHDALNRRSAA